MKTATKKHESGVAHKSSERTRKSGSGESEGFRTLFINELKDIYWAEKALTKAIPKMIKNAVNEDLVDALNGHLEVTEEQVAKLEEVFSMLDEKAAGVKCEAMVGLIAEADEIMKENDKGSLRDLGIILAGQKVEHYEIATYGTLAAFAKKLGENEVANILHEILAEEKEADVKLSEVSESILAELGTEEVEEEEEMELEHSKSKRH